MNLLLGYQSGSAVHELDPRVKLLWLVGNSLLVLWAQDARVAAWTVGMVLLTVT